MPRYKSQNLKRQYSQDDVDQALSDMRSGMSARAAAVKHKVPRATLGDYKTGKSAPNLPLGRHPILPRDVERRIVETAQEAASLGCGVNRKGLLDKTGMSIFQAQRPLISRKFLT